MTAKTKPNANGPVILLADDDEEIAELLSSSLERHGFRVLRAASGYDALGLILGEFKGSIDAVVSDLHMPNGSGENLLEALRKMDQALPVFLMTGDIGYDVARVMKAGCTGVIFKPIDMDTLATSLRTALGARAA